MLVVVTIQCQPFGQPALNVLPLPFHSDMNIVMNHSFITKLKHTKKNTKEKNSNFFFFPICKQKKRTNKPQKFKIISVLYSNFNFKKIIKRKTENIFKKLFYGLNSYSRPIFCSKLRISFLINMYKKNFFFFFSIYFFEFIFFFRQSTFFFPRFFIEYFFLGWRWFLSAFLKFGWCTHTKYHF